MWMGTIQVTTTSTTLQNLFTSFAYWPMDKDKFGPAARLTTMTWTLVILSIVLELAIAQNFGQVPSVVIPGTVSTIDQGTCPTREEMETARDMLHNAAVDILKLLKIFTVPNCGAGLWHRVAFLNTSDPTQHHCPSAWREFIVDGIRLRARPLSNVGSCPGTFYPVSQNYSKVCGRVIGYQSATPSPFSYQQVTIDEAYLDGISITYSTPRNHIWSYAAGASEQGTFACPCAGGESTPPSFVGNNYYCESAYNGPKSFSFDPLSPNDPLWDGLQCEGTCCTGTNTPPWFSVDLSHSTNDDIEVRICHDQHTNDEDTPIQLLELYVQ